jgi:hypothetical protein
MVGKPGLEPGPRSPKERTLASTLFPDVRGRLYLPRMLLIILFSFECIVLLCLLAAIRISLAVAVRAK